MICIFFSFSANGDFSKYADDSDDGSDEDDSDMSDLESFEQEDEEEMASDEDLETNEDHENDDNEEQLEKVNTVPTIDIHKKTEEEAKSQAVVLQHELYDRIFESRIQMQKLNSKSHHLPQPDVYPQFEEEV